MKVDRLYNPTFPEEFFEHAFLAGYHGLALTVWYWFAHIWRQSNKPQSFTFLARSEQITKFVIGGFFPLIDSYFRHRFKQMQVDRRLDIPKRDFLI